MVGKLLETDPDITVVDTAVNGKRAIDALDNNDIEVVVLDIEMPVMDGLTALPKLIEKKPGLQVVIASTLSERNAEISLKAMSMGAVDYVPKPTTGRIGQSIDFQKELLDKVKIYGGVYRKAAGRKPRRSAPSPAKQTAEPASPARAPPMVNVITWVMRTLTPNKAATFSSSWTERMESPNRVDST